MIDNTIMTYSLLWPGSTDGVAGSAKTDETSAKAGSEPVSQFVNPAANESGPGWLPVGMGENVDLMA